MKKFWKIKEILQDALAPTFKCMNCGADVFDETGFCQNCLKEVVFNNGKTCRRCGVAIYGDEDYCGNCAFDKIYFDRAFSPFSYQGAVQKALLNLKFHHIATNAKVLARYLVYMAMAYGLQYDLVTFVPMTEKAQKVRGYNQAELLAKYFCDILDVSDKFVCALCKMKDTERQESLGKRERKENLVGAFSAQGFVKGKVVLLIDDIKTTGATLNECAKALKKKGATKVICITVASREENFTAEVEMEV